VTNSFEDRTVLVVEDDWLLRDDIVSDLRRDGWNVLETGTGAGAMVTLRETDAIDLLITDIRLADALTGWDVAEAFRESHPLSPVIYASGNAPNNSRLVKDSWFLSKPTSISQIMRA
jgi:CheY-like chemotaxis protein